MKIGRLHIPPAENTPEIILDPAGIIKIKGRGLIVNRTEVPEQIMNWIGNYLHHPADTTDIIIAFEYLNSFSTVILGSILKKAAEVSLQKKKLVVHWYYEEDDVDIMERGEYISTNLNIPIDFVETDDIKSCC